MLCRCFGYLHHHLRLRAAATVNHGHSRLCNAERRTHIELLFCTDFMMIAIQLFSITALGEVATGSLHRKMLHIMHGTQLFILELSFILTVCALKIAQITYPEQSTALNHSLYYTDTR